MHNCYIFGLPPGVLVWQILMANQSRPDLPSNDLHLQHGTDHQASMAWTGSRPKTLVRFSKGALEVKWFRIAPNWVRPKPVNSDNAWSCPQKSVRRDWSDQPPIVWGSVRSPLRQVQSIRTGLQEAPGQQTLRGGASVCSSPQKDQVTETCHSWVVHHGQSHVL